MTAPRSRFIAVPAIQGSLRLRLVRGPANEPIVEFSTMVRSERSDGACEVIEGGRAHVGLDCADELINAIVAIRAEHHAAEAASLRVPRLKTMPSPAPMRSTRRASEADQW